MREFRHDTNVSVFAKRVLTYWENRRNLGCSNMNVFIVPIDIHLAVVMQDYPYLPQISQFISTLFPNMESNSKHIKLVEFPLYAL